MENELDKAAIEVLSQRLYREVVQGTPAPEAIAYVRQAVEKERLLTKEQLRLLVTGAAIQAYNNRQHELEEALLYSLGEENWDIRTYEVMVMKTMRQGKTLEAWKIFKKCERRFGAELPSRNKFETCKRIAERPDSKQSLEAILQEDPNDEVVKAFQMLNRALELKTRYQMEAANHLASQISIADTSLHLRLGREMIKRGFIAQGTKLAKTTTDENRRFFVTVANQLFSAGHPREAAEVIEPVIKLGIVRNASTAGVGVELDALNQLAKCARADAVVRQRFNEEMERLQRTGELPLEYWHKVMLVFRTGRNVDVGSLKHRDDPKLKVTAETKRRIQDMPKDTNQVGTIALPALDQSGEGRKIFEAFLMQGAFVQAAGHLSRFRGKVSGRVISQYEDRLHSALSAGAHTFEVWNGVLDANPEDRAVLTLALKSFLTNGNVDAAITLFTQRHGGNVQNGRMFGQFLFDTGKRGNAHPSNAALMVLHAGHPKVAVEIIKPILLNFIASGHQIPLHVLEAFARCAAVDREIRNDFFDQLRDYRKHHRLSESSVDALLAVVYSDEDELLQEKVGRAHQMTQPNGGEEAEEEYIGRVARSKFFQDPHTLLKAQPVDKTAGLVSGKSRRPRRKRWGQ